MDSPKMQGKARFIAVEINSVYHYMLSMLYKLSHSGHVRVARF